MLLESAVNVSEKSKKEILDKIMLSNTSGFCNISNECDYCKEALLPTQSLDNYVYKMIQQQLMQREDDT